MAEKVLVCGGTNFMGPHLIKRLLREYEVTVLSRGLHECIYAEQVRMVRYDINSQNNGKRIPIEGETFDYIIDFSAYTPQAVNNILSKCSTKKYVLISSMGVYPEYHVNIKEEEFNPYIYPIHNELMIEDDYGLRKRSAEALAVQKYISSNPSIIRLGYVIDDVNPEHKNNSRLWNIVYFICNDIPISPQYLEFELTFTRAEEVAELILTVIKSVPEVSIINCASKGSVSLMDLVHYIEQRTNKKAIFSEKGETTWFRGDGVSGVILNLDKIEKIFNISDISWIYKLLDYYIEKQYKPISWEKIIITGEKT